MCASAPTRVHAAERPAPSFTLDLLLATVTIRAPQRAVPAVDAVTHAPPKHDPSQKDLVFHNGLAGTAAVGLIPRPVAAAVGIGTVIAQRGAPH